MTANAVDPKDALPDPDRLLPDHNTMADAFALLSPVQLVELDRVLARYPLAHLDAIRPTGLFPDDCGGGGNTYNVSKLHVWRLGFVRLLVKPKLADGTYSVRYFDWNQELTTWTWGGQDYNENAWGVHTTDGESTAASAVTSAWGV